MTVSKYKFSVVIAEAKELLDFIHTLWHRPLLDSIEFASFHRHAITSDLYTQKFHRLENECTLTLFNIKFIIL